MLLEGQKRDLEDHINKMEVQMADNMDQNHEKHNNLLAEIDQLREERERL